MIKSVYFIVEFEHDNDDQFCTAYSRSTIRRRLYTSRASAEHAADQMESKFPKDRHGFAEGPNFGQIRFVVMEAQIDENKDSAHYYLWDINEGSYERVYDKFAPAPK